MKLSGKVSPYLNPLPLEWIEKKQVSMLIVSQGEVIQEKKQKVLYFCSKPDNFNQANYSN